MSDHLPECLFDAALAKYADRTERQQKIVADLLVKFDVCICPILRACEARVREARIVAPPSCVDCGEPIYIRSNGDANHVTPSAEGPHGIHYAVAPNPVHHDPICRGKDGVNDCHCRLIAKVRMDERSAALDAARDAVAAHDCDPSLGVYCDCQMAALAAIDAIPR